MVAKSEPGILIFSIGVKILLFDITEKNEKNKSK